MTAPRITTPRRAGRRGQSLVEVGIVIPILVLLIMGTLEFGRAFMIANVVTHATRDGARAAAVVPPADRNSSGIITSPASIQNKVRSDIANVVDASGFTVSVQQPTIGGIPMVRVNVQGTVPYIFNLPGVGTSFTVSRSLTFRDEGR
jgi:Flp pilus assembly protein TadG